MQLLTRRNMSIDTQADLVMSSRMIDYVNEDAPLPSKVLKQLSNIHVYHPKGFASLSKRSHKSFDSNATI